MKQTIEYPCGSIHSSCYPVEVTLFPGVYLFQVSGGSGGDTVYGSRTDAGGKGGYSSGFYIVARTIKVYVYIGAKGRSNHSQNSLGGWNGGGNSRPYGGSGGGSTDIRTIGGDWNSTTSLQSRIIVAGGGGGAYGGSSCHSPGPDGGGENGNRISMLIGCSGSDWPVVCIGTQSNCDGGDDYSQTLGGFGYGGFNHEDFSPGGGGGYWGGGSGVRVSGSGSGFIGGVTSFSDSFPHTDAGMNSGDGHAVISYIKTVFCPSQNGILHVTEVFISSYICVIFLK